MKITTDRRRYGRRTRGNRGTRPKHAKHVNRHARGQLRIRGTNTDRTRKSQNTRQEGKNTRRRKPKNACGEHECRTIAIGNGDNR